MSEEKRNNNRTLKEILENLSNNMMFKLSLGSKELFHSNYWAHLLKTYPDTFKTIFYPECKIEDTVDSNCVHREMEHTDISFRCNKELIIIENKCKDQPKIEQIVNYINKNNPHKIILISFFEPSFDEENIRNEIKNKEVKYQYISYDTLSKNFNEIKNDTSKNNELKANVYFEEYCSMLENIVALKEVLLLKGDKKYSDIINEISDAETEKIAKEFNFLSTLKKLFMNQLRCDLLKDLKNLPNLKDKKIYTHVDFQYGKAYLDILIDIKENNCNIKKLGLQLFKCKNEINPYFELEKGIDVDEQFLQEKSIFQDISDKFSGYISNFTDDTSDKFLGFDKNKKNKELCWLYKHTNINLLEDLTYKNIKDYVSTNINFIINNYL